MEDKIYCIYKGDYILKSESSIEHIIPTSLGGCDKFVVMVDRNLNSYMGRTVDANMANDFIVRLYTIRKGYKGHSKREPVLKIKKANINKLPVSIQFKKGGMEVYDPVEKRIIKEGVAISMETQIDLLTRIQFVAKVALATGYFAYGELFVKYADHNLLREFVMTEDSLSKEIKGLRFYDSFSKVDGKEKGKHETIKFLIKTLGGSSVIINFAKNRMIVSVGVAGKYIGMVNFHAEVDKFPVCEENRLGKVFQCKDNELRGGSFWSAINQLNKEFGIVDINDSELD